MRVAGPDYGKKNILKEGLDSAPSLTRPRRHVPWQKPHCSSSPSTSGNFSSADGINAPISSPPILTHLSSYMRHARERPKPYQRSSLTLAERLVGGSVHGCKDSKNPLDVQRNKETLEHTLKTLSSEALAQAVVSQHAEVEWRRLCALTTAWQIEAIEQHTKLLHMILECEAQTYANAASEPLDSSVKELVSCTSKEELKEQKKCTVDVYDDDATSFIAADAELDDIEAYACAHFHLPANNAVAKDFLQATRVDSDASATSSDEDHSFGSMRGTSRNSTESDD
ncbi:hypothetical protein EDD22DRAFT_843465 [Suillus occidentalis]|nr:hypothetical protein EDD22DRAFT_843465 [Suillus occidentalis]